MKTLYDEEEKNHHFKDLYDKFYTIGYYSGFYSSLRDEIWANGDYFEFLSKDKDGYKYSSWINQIHF